MKKCHKHILHHSKRCIGKWRSIVLPTKKLLEISDIIQKYFPEIRILSQQASIRNIKNKTVEELKQLSEAKYNDLYIELETAHDDTLKLMNKRFTQKDQYEQLKKLQEADINYIAH